MPLSIHGYGTRVLVDVNSPAEVAIALRNFLPPQVSIETAEHDAEADARFVVSEAKPNAFEITSDGAVVGRADTDDALIQNLRSHIELAIASFARLGTFVHAGAVAWRSTVVLIPGASYAGKSTLVAELVRCGAVYLSDEYAVVDSGGLVHAYPRPIHLRQGGATIHPPHGDVPLEAGLIVATRYQPGATWAPVILKGARAMLPLLDNVIVVKERPAQGLQLAGRLAARVATLRGVRPEAPLVAPAILEFLDSVLDDRRASSVKQRDTATSPVGPIGADARTPSAPPLRKLRTLPHFRIDHFLEPLQHRRLLDYAIRRQEDLEASKLVDGGLINDDTRERRLSVAGDVDDIWRLFDAHLRRLLPHVRSELGLPWFRLDEVEGRLHVRGGHVAIQPPQNNRRVSARRCLTAIYCFGEMPESFRGSELFVYDRAEGMQTAARRSARTLIEAADNSLIFVPGEVAHGLVAFIEQPAGNSCFLAAPLA